MSATRASPKVESPGLAVGGTASRATKDNTQQRILRATRQDRKRRFKAERIEIAARMGAINLHVLLGDLDPLLWAPKLLGWAFTPAQRSGLAIWYVTPAWSPVAVRAGLDADVREWLRPRPGECLRDWYSRVRHQLIELATEQGAAIGGEGEP